MVEISVSSHLLLDLTIKGIDFGSILINCSFEDSLAHSFLVIIKEFGIEVRSRIVDDVEQIKRFTYNDVEYTKFVDYVINEEGVADPGLFRTQYIISALVTAMTDNAKERLAAKLGIKKQTLGMVTQMTGMGQMI